MSPVNRRRPRPDASASADSAPRPSKSLRISADNMRFNRESIRRRDDVVHGTACETPRYQYRSPFLERPRIEVHAPEIEDDEQIKTEHREIEEGEIVEKNNSGDDVVKPQPQEKVEAEILLLGRSTGSIAAGTWRPSSSSSSFPKKRRRLEFESPDDVEINAPNKRRIPDPVIPSYSLEQNQFRGVTAANNLVQEITEDEDKESEGNVGFYFCYCCERENFKTEKSLSGHMRCHPNRTWRGIRPPTGVVTPFSWKETRNTNRKKGIGCESKPSPPPFTLTTPPIENIITKHKRRTSVPHGSNENEAVSSLLMLQNVVTVPRAQRHNSSDSSNTGVVSKHYPCHQCNRVFTTYQALGGHTASHNRGKIFGEEPTFSSNGTNADITTPDHADSNDVTDPEEFNCNLCPKSFPSEQAVAGHMSRFQSPETEFGKMGHLLDFDLNELPREDNDEI